MNSALIDNLVAQLDGPRDGALLRFSLANALFDDGQYADAAERCRQALQFDSDYSAAWKLCGKALRANGATDAAADAWRRGAEVAAHQGDKQAEKEMRVFLKRLP